MKNFRYPKNNTITTLDSKVGLSEATYLPMTETDCRRESLVILSLFINVHPIERGPAQSS